MELSHIVSLGLDIFEVKGQQGEGIELRRRPEIVPVVRDKHGRAVVRDNQSIILSKLQTAPKGALKSPPSVGSYIMESSDLCAQRRLMASLVGTRATNFSQMSGYA